MNLQRYLELKQRPRHSGRKMRALCSVCLQPLVTCYCVQVRRFDPKIKFVILIHALEVRRRVATGRMAHLCLERSELIMGYDYSNDPRVNSLIEDPRLDCRVLYPGPHAINLSQQSLRERQRDFGSERELVVFVIDGTWSTARKMLRRSQNLSALPQMCFSPPRLSRFRVRQQPKPECYSTVEAIHHVVELLGPARGFNLFGAEHENLLRVFDHMVNQQLEFIERSHATQQGSRHQRKPAAAGGPYVGKPATAGVQYQESK